MSISIVIRAFNEEENIGRLLKGITQQTYKDYEIIVVDSGSTDSTVEIAEQYQAKIVNISPNEFTFGRSLNMGIDASKGDFVVIISAHCYPVYPDWLEYLIKPLLDDTNIAMSYGKQIGGTKNYYSEHRIFKKYFPDHSVSKQGHPYSHNANAAIRRALWIENHYNENLTGLEDLAWSSWAMESGYSIAYVAEAEVVHLHNETMKQVYNRYKREAIALKQILPKSEFPFNNFIRFFIKESLLDLIQANRERRLIKNIRSIIWFRLMQYWGTYNGFHYTGKIDAKLHHVFFYPPDILDKKIPEKRSTKPINYQDETISK